MSAQLEDIAPRILPQRPRTAPYKLAHLVFRTPRYDEMVDWYLKVLDADLVFRTPMFTFLAYDDEHHRLAFVNQPQLSDPDPFASGVDHIAFTYRSMADLLATYERLKSIGIEPGWCINHGGTTSMYFADPDGNQIELQIDNFDTVEELTEWMGSGVLELNPIGVEFDPAILAEKFKAGVPMSELIKQGSTSN